MWGRKPANILKGEEHEAKLKFWSNHDQKQEQYKHAVARSEEIRDGCLQALEVEEGGKAESDKAWFEQRERVAEVAEGSEQIPEVQVEDIQAEQSSCT